MLCASALCALVYGLLAYKNLAGALGTLHRDGPFVVEKVGEPQHRRRQDDHRQEAGEHGGGKDLAGHGADGGVHDELLECAAKGQQVRRLPLQCIQVANVFEAQPRANPVMWRMPR